MIGTLTDRILLHGQLKFKVFFSLPNCCEIYHQIFLTSIASKSLKLSFSLNCVLKRAKRPWQTRTHCCGYIVADTNVSPFARSRNICCGHKFCVRETKMCLILFRNILCPQQMFPSLRSPRNITSNNVSAKKKCVRNNVSSFTRTFRKTISCNRSLFLCHKSNLSTTVALGTEEYWPF